MAMRRDKLSAQAKLDCPSLVGSPSVVVISLVQELPLNRAYSGYGEKSPATNFVFCPCLRFGKAYIHSKTKTFVLCCYANLRPKYLA
jgi:hypothetical protein